MTKLPALLLSAVTDTVLGTTVALAAPEDRPASTAGPRAATDANPGPTPLVDVQPADDDGLVPVEVDLLSMPRIVAGKPIDPTEWNRNDGFSVADQMAAWLTDGRLIDVCGVGPCTIPPPAP